MSTLSSSKNHSKKVINSSRERDKIKPITSESGGSSQCDTPPLTEKDGSSTQGKFAGIGPDSIICMGEQIGAEMSAEAATNLAEDVSYKLRQTISAISLHSELMKKSVLDSWDVNTLLMLTDTSPIIGTSSTQYTTITSGDEKLCVETETLVNITDKALKSQSYVFSSVPTMTVEWIMDERSLSGSSNIGSNLQNYYTKVARAILNLKKKPKQIAVQDLTTNTRIGPIFPNLFNLAVLVLNDDNLNALNVPAKKPLQSNVLDMVDALCSNPCSMDTNIQQQFQRLFPVMVSNILGNGSLAEKMVAILTKITRTWPSFIIIGKGILFDYLSQGTKDRLTAPMIRCVMALGRGALIECLGDHLEHLDNSIHAPRRNHRQCDLRETMLDVSTCLLRSELTTYLEDFVTTDYTLYEMLGDSILPRRTLFPYLENQQSESEKSEKCDEDLYMPLRTLCRAKVKVIPPNVRKKLQHDVFEVSNYRRRSIVIKIKNCRSLNILKPNRTVFSGSVSDVKGVLIASGLLNRFKYNVKQDITFPVFGALSL
ncbi:uncharacterized protein LOC126971775 [Leptidea sinapis]|uniref:uncharacterized protein LOC126971775 n=1 Tax=Leptidea sinapis TaxID=189913 RepID=UPI0021449C30|nr:uncharacterized protein LOC126971775 [Leptidea sinapis]